MRYVRARYEEHQRDLAYRFYVSESLFAIGQGKGVGKSFIEIYNGFDEKPDPRTTEQIIEDSIARAGIIVNG